MIRRLACVLGVALLTVACGDDDDAAPDAGADAAAARGGRGGASGLGGGGAGRGGSGGGGSAGREPPRCDKADLEDDLEAWCSDPSKECGISPEERWQRLCRRTNCARECASLARNSCGGYSISYVRGLDVYSDQHFYDADGTLVGVNVRPFSYPCTNVKHTYGTPCTYEEPAWLPCVDEADGGTD